MKILQIGEGFIGTRLAEKLRVKGHEVVTKDLLYGDDITHMPAVEAWFKKDDFDVVILMAAVSNLNIFDKDPLVGMKVNVGGVINVAHQCMLNHAKLAFISTCCAYGNTPELPSSEEAPLKPTEVYAASKIAGEWIIKGYNLSYGMEYNILRIATCYGPGMRPALAPAVFINQIRRAEPITIHGNGKQTRTMTYVDDNVDGIITVIESGVVNETFNISSPEELSVNDMADAIRKVMGNADHPIKHLPDRKGQTLKEKIDTGKIREIRLWPQGRYAPSNTKAKQVAGWEAKVSFRDGIRKTLDWMDQKGLKEIPGNG